MASLIMTVACTGAQVVYAGGTTAGEWREENGTKYWYENGVKQGTERNL